MEEKKPRKTKERKPRKPENQKASGSWLCVPGLVAGWTPQQNKKEKKMKLAAPITQALIALGVTSKSAEKAALKYANVMLSHIQNSILEFGITNDQFSLPILQMREEMGKLTILGKQHWILNLIQQHHDATIKFVNIDFKGNTGLNTRASFNQLIVKQIMEELINVAAETTPKRLMELQKNANVQIDTNPNTLASFIRKTEQTYKQALADNRAGAYVETLFNNLLIAKAVLTSMQVDSKGQHYVDEYWIEYDSGRMYGQGLSLQRVPKEVRHAALGPCFRYDFKASAYALLTGLAVQIDPELKVADLTDYVRNRATIRASIAEQVGTKEDRIKTVFSAIGFGARTANNPYASIRSLLGKESYDKLMACKQFLDIKDAFDRVTDVIDEYFGEEFELCGIKYNPIDPKTDKKRNKAQKLAWIYQVMETEAASRFFIGAHDRGYKYLLWVHDCLYFKHRINDDIVNDILRDMKNSFPFINVDREHIMPIQDEIGMEELFREENAFAEQHKSHISCEEIKAKFFRPRNAEAVEA